MSERCAIHPDRAAEITCTRCGNFSCYECVGPIGGGVCARCRMRVGGGSSIAQVRPLAIVGIVHGVLLTLLGGMYVLVGAVMAIAPPDGRHGNEPPPAFMGVVFVAFALVHVAPGVLQIIAGVRLLREKGRGLAIAAFASGLLSMIGCYCGPSAVALAVWGIIVLNSAEVRARFASPGGE